MSWYQKGHPDIVEVKFLKHKTAMTTTPSKSYVQVPNSSSPIRVRSSPDHGNMDPPSKQSIDNEKQKQLEKKRQQIRSHKDYGLVRARFHYLSESDVMKGFVKGRGNLRDITKWLEDNYNKEEYMKQIDKEKFEKQRLDEIEKQKVAKAKWQWEIKQGEEQRRAIDVEKEAESGLPNDEEDESPIKIKGRARSKNPIEGSPTKSLSSSSSGVGSGSTKVEIKKPKLSILDKYTLKPKLQMLLDHFRHQLVDDQPIKKRKLIRALDNFSSNSLLLPSPITTTRLPLLQDNITSKFAYSATKLKKTSFSIESKFASANHDTLDGMIVDDVGEDDVIVADDDLERLEEKIRNNRRNKKLKNQTKRNNYSDEDDDDLLENDEMSDDMSEEDDEVFVSGLTSIDGQILEFLNGASANDIAEIANIPIKVAELLLEKRPFNTIYEVLEDNFELPSESTEQPTTKRRYVRKKLGLKIVENTEFSLKGYKAVDSLIKTCSDYGNLINSQIEKWGVKITGEGELEMTDIEPLNDSGTATPVIIDLDQKQEEEEEDEEVVITKPKKKGLKYVTSKPALLAEDVELKNYQQVGINWLNLLYRNQLSCILADEMGLGKTCQVISFMAYLKEVGEKNGPHMVVVPASTIENWLREFKKFCPDMKVQAYYGLQSEREELRRFLLYEANDYEVLVTTYNLATGAAPDFKFLKSQKFNMIVYDEGHMLKNSTSERYNKLMRLKAKFRLLLTGTPLQNNLKELVSLLAFMLPDLFNEKKDDLQSLFNQKASTVNSDRDPEFNPLLSQQAINKAKTMMTPFVLRRKKNQVLKHLPGKFHEVVSCEMNADQKKIYDQYLNEGRATRKERDRRNQLSAKEAEEARQVPIPSTSNVMMSLRKAALHPLLFRRHYDDTTLELMSRAIINEPEYAEANKQYIFEDMQVMSDYELASLCGKFPKTLGKFMISDSKYMNSGKVKHLTKLLHEITRRKEKVLVFSLFTQMLDVLEKVLSILGYKFLRLDGQTSVETRQDLIDKFYDDETIPIFLLSTKAGGFGINLVAANNVIIYDQSFNPHDDKQAEDRAHRVGQNNEVIVYKLISKNTIEENILQLAENKLQLDQSLQSDGQDRVYEEKAASMFELILFAT
ncbi:uncharacterized protein KQ657_000366 [Scheffersomyces spartinae]|uniref:DNA helicase n=1 Tax=Scheffersomyces spartinae TaxID=45513 RepID=A0A9P8AIH4_9ASCO|nr:uncharacterized protein KQ657_000366 [Scheffersomyces spartinae]KAG7193679.1 hypothetical protein KQ657_000366 [Scheffersomyces spartinae]